MTAVEVRAFVKALGRPAVFAEELRLPGFEEAFGNYHVALWRWVWSLTPQDVISKLNETTFQLPDTDESRADFCVHHHKYLFWRCIFLAGLKAGEGYKSSHYRYFARYALVADELDDKTIFEAARQHRHGGKPKEGHELHRKLKFDLLVGWIAGGLWRMASRGRQLNALKSRRPRNAPFYSAEALAMAQKRLGLRWKSGKPPT